MRQEQSAEVPGRIGTLTDTFAIPGPSDTLQFIPTLQVGTMSTPSVEVFGRIESAVVDTYGRLYVIDSRLNVLRVYSQEGRLLAEVGRSGRGPGEFAGLRALTITNHGTAIALDRRLGRLSEFDWVGDSLHLSSLMAIDFVANDLCSIGDRIIILGLSDGMLVHEIGDAGQVIASWGVAESDNNPILHDHLSEAIMTCDEAGQRVYVLHRFQPRVRSFDVSPSDAGEVWEAEVPSWIEEEREIGPQGGVTFSLPEGGVYHIGLGLLNLPPDMLVVQLGMVDKDTDGPETIRPARVVLFDSESGSILAEVEGSPRLVWSEYKWLTSIVNSPIPRVGVFRIDSKYQDGPREASG